MLVAVVVLLGLLGILGYFVVGGWHNTQELSQAQVQKTPEVVGATYSSDFLWESICSIQVSIGHEEGTTVDEISFTFSPIITDAMFLKAPDGYPWPLAQFQKTTDGKGVTYSIPDAGFRGAGTINFEFQIRKDILGNYASLEDEIRLHVDFTMHKDGVLKATKQHAEGEILLGIP